MNEILQITRAELLDVTERVIADTRKIPDELAERLRVVARTAPYVAHNAWQMVTPMGYCGCLVGWLHDPEACFGEWVPSFRADAGLARERGVGILFHERLCDLLADKANDPDEADELRKPSRGYLVEVTR